MSESLSSFQKRDARFFPATHPQSLEALSRQCFFSLPSPEEGSYLICDVATLQEAGEHHVTFFDNRRYRPLLQQTRAAACLVRAQDQADVPSPTRTLVAPDPYRSYALIAQALYPTLATHQLEEGVHPTAQVHPSAYVGSNCYVGAYAVIGARARIGPGTQIGTHVSIGPGCHIGDQCYLESHVSLAYCIMGDRVHVHAGARLGQPGFGFHMGAEGFTLIPQLGRVVVGDDVRIGANTAIDRGSLEDTVIESGSMIDNLVQIGHNVILGHHCVLAGQVGIAGSATLEAQCVLGGKTGVAGHLHMGRGTRVAAMSGVTQNTPPQSVLAGMPAQPIQQWRRVVALQKKLLKQKGVAQDREKA